MKSLFKKLTAIATRNENNEYRYKLGSVKRVAKLRQLQLGILSFFTMASVLVLPNSAKAATTTLNFNDTSPTRLSGNALSQGAVYRFKNVTTGVDALVTIAQISNSTLVSLDDNSSFSTRFQPVIKQIGANNTSYIRFDFQLVVSGTTTPTSVPNLYFSSQDTDGNGVANGVREFVEIVNSQVTYIPNPTFLAEVPPIAGGVRYQHTDSSNFQPGIGTDDRYELYSYIGTSVSNFSVIGGSSSGSNTSCNSTTNTGCDRQNSWTFNVVDVQPLDFGDAPETYGYAAHVVPPTQSVFFGATVDGDDAPNYSTNADGDDLAGSDDEDGVTSFPALTTSSTSYSVTASCKGSNIPVAAWIDFNRNGVFDTGERTSGTCNNTSVTLNWTGLTGLSAGKTYARFRIASNASDITSPNNNASDGEVEDYSFNITTSISGTLYEDSDGGDDLDAGEPKLPANITVNLLDNSDNVIKTTITDANGAYTFTGITNDNYKIQVDTTDTDIPDGYTLGTPNDLPVSVSGSPISDQNFGFDKPTTNRPLGSPFTCDSTFYITIGPGGGKDQQLYDVDRSGPTFTFNPIGAATNTAGGYPVNFDYNALAFNPIDNYIYAIINRSDATDGPYSPGNVVKIGNDGIVHSLGIPTGGNISGSFFAASILSDGTYVIGAGGKFATLDVTTTPPTITNSQVTVSGIQFNDFAVDPRNPASLSGKEVYGINENGSQDRLVILDMTSFPPTITSQATNPTGFNHNAGSQFVDAFGTLYYRSNNTNTLYKVDTDSNSPDYGKATAITTAPSGGNHDGVSCLFATAMEKEVQNIDGSPITEPVPAGETVQYVYKIATGNPLDLNGVTFTDDLRSVTGGNPVNGTFLADSGKVTVSNGSGNIAFDNSNQTLQITNLTLPGQDPATPESETLTITAEVTVPKTLTPGTYLNQSFLTNLPAIYPPSIRSDYPPSAPYEDPTPVAVTEPIANNPNVLLIKRITKINGNTTTNGGDNLSIYNQDNSNPYDDNKLEITELPENEGDPKPDTDKWFDTVEDTTSNFLIGGINGGKVEPNDELEYTIYFLSTGDTEAENVLFCDRVPGNVSFIPTSFNNEPQATGGAQGSDRGILWFNNGNTESLTNTQDGDVAQYFPPGVEPSTVYPKIKCDGANTNGAVVVNLSNLPNATAPGTPNTSYGFVRFRGRVK